MDHSNGDDRVWRPLPAGWPTDPLASWQRWKQETISFFEQLLPDPPYVSYMDLKPSWLRGPAGERLTIDLFYPDLPLAIGLARPITILDYSPDQFVMLHGPESEWNRQHQIRRVLGQLQVPYLVLRPDYRLDLPLIRNLIRSAAEQAWPGQAERWDQLLHSLP